MSNDQQFNFGDDSIANGYDSVLVPVLFKPWADQLAEDFRPWGGRSVLDLAAGTGIVTQTLADWVGPEGEIIAVDINSEMLALARKRVNGKNAKVTFLESPAYPMEINDDAVDFVVCQQGLQFFPDRTDAAREIHRVLKPNGTAVITTWCPVKECEMFGAICEALEEIGCKDISENMRLPFDHMPAEDLHKHFEPAGFRELKVWKQEKELLLEQGPSQAIKMVYACPIGPKLKALPEEKQSEFQAKLTKKLKRLSPDGKRMGKMVTNGLTAVK